MTSLSQSRMNVAEKILAVIDVNCTAKHTAMASAYARLVQLRLFAIDC